MTQSELDAALALAEKATPDLVLYDWRDLERQGSAFAVGPLPGTYQVPKGFDEQRDGALFVARTAIGVHIRSRAKNAAEAIDDATFFVAARTLVPRLVAEVRRWRREWAMEHMKHSQQYGIGGCLSCEEARKILAEGKRGCNEI